MISLALGPGSSVRSRGASTAWSKARLAGRAIGIAESSSDLALRQDLPQRWHSTARLALADRRVEKLPEDDPRGAARKALTRLRGNPSHPKFPEAEVSCRAMTAMKRLSRSFAFLRAGLIPRFGHARRGDVRIVDHLRL